MIIATGIKFLFCSSVFMLKFKGADAYLAGIEELTDDKLCQELRTHGVEAGPIVNTTRLLYQKKLAEAMANRAKGVAIWGDGGLQMDARVTDARIAQTMGALRRDIRAAQRLLAQLQREQRDRQAAQGEAADNGGVEAGVAGNGEEAAAHGAGEAGTGIGGEEVPVAIPQYFQQLVAQLRNHPTVLPTTMLGLTNIDKNEAIVVRTTMASQQLGISPQQIPNCLTSRSPLLLVVVVSLL
eukprot:Em0015g1303a